MFHEQAVPLLKQIESMRLEVVTPRHRKGAHA